MLKAPEKKIRVLVADDSAFMCKVLQEIINADPSMEVAGQARDGRAAVTMAAISRVIAIFSLVVRDAAALCSRRSRRCSHKVSGVVTPSRRIATRKLWSPGSRT